MATSSAAPLGPPHDEKIDGTLFNVVISGAIPGIYSNPAEVLYAIRNVPDANVRSFETFDQASHAQSIFEVCVWKGFVVVEELYPRVPTEDDLNACTKCLYQKDADFTLVNS